MTVYAQNIETWEPWQRDYRLGLILILPPREVSEPVDALRGMYDSKSQAICPPHISVSDPLAYEMTAEIELSIRSVLKDIEPFDLCFDELHASDKHPGISYRIHPEAPIRSLQQTLHGSSAFSDAAYRRREIQPHMTIAEFISIEESIRICRELQNTAPQGTFTCDSVEFIVPDESFHFQKVKTFKFGEDRP